jgi:hypothetical protein
MNRLPHLDLIAFRMDDPVRERACSEWSRGALGLEIRRDNEQRGGRKKEGI